MKFGERCCEGVWIALTQPAPEIAHALPSHKGWVLRNLRAGQGEDLSESTPFEKRPPLGLRDVPVLDEGGFGVPVLPALQPKARGGTNRGLDPSDLRIGTQDWAFIKNCFLLHSCVLWLASPIVFGCHLYRFAFIASLSSLRFHRFACIGLLLGMCRFYGHMFVGPRWGTLSTFDIMRFFSFSKRACTYVDTCLYMEAHQQAYRCVCVYIHTHTHTQLRLFLQVSMSK